jgi:hypothetical protein
MADITAGEVFVNSEQVTGGRLNNHVNAAVIQPAFISGKSSQAPTTDDSIVYYDAGSALLKKATFAQVSALGGVGTVTSVSLALPVDTFAVGGAVTSTGTLTATYDNQTAGKAHIAPVATTGVPTWRRLEARDMQLDAVNIASAAIDWNLGDVFWKQLTGNHTFNFLNNVAGRVIYVLLGNSVASPAVAWNDVNLWPAGTAPVQTTGINRWDWYQFTQCSANVFGVRIAANMSA